MSHRLTLSENAPWGLVKGLCFWIDIAGVLEDPEGCDAATDEDSSDSEGWEVDWLDGDVIVIE
jgi:hypothetical protein